MQYTVVPTHQMLDYLSQRLGNQAAYFDQNLFAYMRHHCGSLYDGGLWELRVFPNNSFALIFPESINVPEVNTLNQMRVSCSLEAVSYAANLHVYSGLADIFAQDNDFDATDLYTNLFHGLRDILLGRMHSVIEGSETRKLTIEEQSLSHEEYSEVTAVLTIIG